MRRGNSTFIIFDHSDKSFSTAEFVTNCRDDWVESRKIFALLNKEGSRINK